MLEYFNSLNILVQCAIATSICIGFFWAYFRIVGAIIDRNSKKEIAAWRARWGIPNDENN